MDEWLADWLVVVKWHVKSIRHLSLNRKKKQPASWVTLWLYNKLSTILIKIQIKKRFIVLVHKEPDLQIKFRTIGSIYFKVICMSNKRATYFAHNLFYVKLTKTLFNKKERKLVS